MSENYCPECGAQVATESINLAEGVALCQSCGKLSRLSDVASRNRPIKEVLRNPPPGCSVTEWVGHVAVRATLRSIGGFLGLLAVALFWNGIVSVFVLIAMVGLYTNLVGPLPPWFPALHMEDPTSLGETLFLCIFLIPFVTIGLIIVGAVLLNAAGRVEVFIDDKEAFVRTGIGYLAWRRRFDPNQVRRVTLGTTTWQSNGQPGQVVVIQADRTIKFGGLLQEERREWLQTVLQELLAGAGPGRRREVLSMVTSRTGQF